MRALLLLPLLLAAPRLAGQLLTQAQLDSLPTYRSLERALAEPGKAFKLDLSRRKLRTVPEELRQLRGLNALDLSGNRLKELPAWLGELQSMQEFRASRNRLGAIPPAVCQWRALKRLDLSRNAIIGLPKCMGQLKQLVSLDLWDNDLAEFPPEIAGMDALRFLDLRNIQFSQQEMDEIRELLPRARIQFSQPCNCGM